MERVLQELFGAHFFGRPYCSKGTKINLDAALTTYITGNCLSEKLSNILRFFSSRKNLDGCFRAT